MPLFDSSTGLRAVLTPIALSHSNRIHNALALPEDACMRHVVETDACAKLTGKQIHQLIFI
jgi:hypothetical protein